SQRSIVATVIVVSTFLETRSDYGADTSDILTARVALTESDYPDSRSRTVFMESLQSRLESTSGVSEVMISSALPGAPVSSPTIAVEGREYDERRGLPRSNYIVVTPGTLDKLGVELREGRYLNSSDNDLGKRTVVVTESFAARQFPGESALSKRVRLASADGQAPDWLTIVGVVEHTSQGRASSDDGKMPSIFRPFGQDPRTEMTIAMRMVGSQAEAVRSLRETLKSIDPGLPAFRIETYERYLWRISAPLRFISTVFLIFGIAAVLLAASGIYGVMSNTIFQRTGEIGVKRALGAVEARITREFLFSGLRQLLIGAIPGLLAGGAMGFAMSTVLGLDMSILAAVALLIVSLTAIVVLAATLLPTRRVLAMEPSEALRHE
ncbi:MAG: ABC transporter permease, partial [Pseudomonadota bacterium]